MSRTDAAVEREATATTTPLLDELSHELERVKGERWAHRTPP
jgi:hypothetical protein